MTNAVAAETQAISAPLALMALFPFPVDQTKSKATQIIFKLIWRGLDSILGENFLLLFSESFLDY
jgi:hypothetical protein